MYIIRQIRQIKMSSVTTQATSYQNGSKIQQGTGIKMIDTLNVEKGATVLDLRGEGGGCRP